MARLRTVSRLAQVPGIGVDRMSNIADSAQDPEILRLENLDTDILPPEIAVKITQENIGLDKNNSYLPFFGQDKLRQAATNHVSRISTVSYNWQTQSIITAGGLSGILNVLLALLEPGDEVILTDPIYAGLINRVRIAGGVTKFVPLIPTPDGWRLDLDILEQAVSVKTRIVLIMSPSMPTGHVLNQEEWAAVTHVCIKADAWLLYDTAMERILFDGRAVMHPASLPGMAERTITVGSVSKEFRMIGWRVGWIVGPQEIMNSIGLVCLSNVVCPVGIAMAGATAALELAPDISHAVEIWQKRRDILLTELHDLPVIPPHGGWSLLLNTKELGYSPAKASELLFKNGKIAATPMVGWGDQAADYLRFVFSNEPENRLFGIGAKIKKALN